MLVKRFFACLLALALLVGMLSGCAAKPSETAAEPMVLFTDSLGRKVGVPASLTRVAPSGAVASMFLAVVAPEYMSTINATPSSSQYRYLNPRLIDLPTTGQMYGSKSTLNLESILSSGAQVVIDIGDKKDNMAADLDALQRQIGIPVIFIEAKLSDYGAAYERLGELLSMEERGSELSTYCTDVYNKTVTTMENIPENERVRMAYLLGDNGLNAIAKTSFQAAVVDMVADNVVVVDDVSGKGNGNEISLEQIALWNPDLIVFQTGSIYDTVGDDPAWAGIAAIDSGNYYQVPNVPYCWLNNPPTVNQLMGLQWLPRLLYPDAFDDSIEDVTRAYYSTMYNYDLSDTELADLIKDAVPKA